MNAQPNRVTSGGRQRRAGFEPVRERFAANFHRDDHCREVGAALTVFHGERCVVDLWAGHMDAGGAQPWRKDTLLNVYSTTKGIVAVCVAMLVDRGVLSYDDTVASVWPEFAQNGKQHITIAQVLSHQAGLPAFEDPTTLEDLYDWHGALRGALAGQKPRWVPGEKTAYHPITYGYLAGEIVRRASGRSSIGEFVQQELATPLEADFFIGLDPALHRRVAETLAPKNLIDPSALPSIEETRLSVTNPMLHPQAANTAAWRSAEMPALNGHASADGIARIYAMLANGGVFQRRRFLSPATIEPHDAGAEQPHGSDAGHGGRLGRGRRVERNDDVLRTEPADLRPFRLGRLVRLRRSGPAARDRLRLQPDGTGSRRRHPRARAVRGDL